MATKKGKLISLIGMIAMIIIAIIIFMTCSKNFSFWVRDVTAKPCCTWDDSATILDHSDDIHFEGDFDRVTQKALVTVGGKLYATIVEKGMLDKSYDFMCGKDTLLSFKFYNAADGELGNKNTSTAYAVYNDQGEIYQYIQEATADLPDGTNEYVFLFYDADKQPFPYYYFDERDFTLREMSDGNVLLKATGDFSSITNIYNINVNITETDMVDMASIELAFIRLKESLKAKQNALSR